MAQAEDPKLDAALVLSSFASGTSPQPANDMSLRIAISASQAAAPTNCDACITGTESLDDLAALFASWLPPDHAPLDRLASAFGRHEVQSLLSNLRAELRAALAALSSGAPCDSHKLCGLAGTLGFPAASQAWRDLDAPNGAQDARRTSRAAIVSISRWLRDNGVPLA